MGSRALALGVLVAACAASSVAEDLEVVLREGTNFAVARSPVDDSFILDLQGTLWRLPSDGGEATALTDGMGDDRMPHISPDGTRVVFQSYRAGTWDIWAANADGSGLAALTDTRFDDREPVFSPDGTRVAFSSDRNGNYDIWVLDSRRRSSKPSPDTRRATSCPRGRLPGTRSRSCPSVIRSQLSTVWSRARMASPRDSHRSTEG